MNLIIKATNLSLTPSLRTYVEEALASVEKLAADADQAAEARVEVGRSSHHHKKGEVFFAEVNLRIGGQVLRSRSEAWSVQAAVDEIKDDLRRELNKFKGKREAVYKRGARAVSKIFRLSPLARWWRRGRIKDEYL
ncbi:MAG: ribosome-associated translation inhibitor RaiA [Parcubacteria group bacterium]|nr:ribosome-associated translation inhibitor RaiA [Parcubacteria group bacterium]